MANNKQMVIAGLSGGVDSAVAAALLLDQGYDVTGVSLDLWHAGPGFSNSEDTYRDAHRVAKHLGIPWILVDRRKSFRDQVVGYYLSSLQKGQTPNPCIVCNRIMKWHSLLETADGLGADYVTTGHYARRHVSETIELHKARDPSKDQSYFLSILGQAELKRTLFPLGEFMKIDVRKYAKDRRIPVADRKESQDLCFLGGMEQRSFITQYAPELLRKGEIVHHDGRILGEHTGLANYTEGQRKGIRIASSAPLYVIRKNIQTNQLIVGEKELLGRSSMTIRDINWIRGKAPGENFSAIVKIRYRAVGLEAEIHVRQDKKLDVRLSRQIRDVTPGQALVMYQGDNCLGMGFIE